LFGTLSNKHIDLSIVGIEQTDGSESIMGAPVIAAIIAITAALVFYSLGVFGERRSGSLSKSHTVLFWCGFACDTAGTSIMTFIARSSGTPPLSLHAVSGVLAIALMLFHALWATMVLFRGSDRQKSNFHRLSVVVWLFWLIPYICGMLLGMPGNLLGEGTSAVVSILIPLALAWGFHLQAHRRNTHLKN
jgi:uncharacterized repeat protein (TIGR03987 family)